ncbi:carbohydrate ABC transporter permease [Nocardia sp. NPDC055321]
MSTESRTRAARGIAAYAILLAGALLTVAPLVLSAMTAAKTPEGFARESALAPPDPATAENFATVLDQGLGRAVLVTALMTAFITFGQLICSIMAAYAFARLSFPGRDVLFGVYLGTMMVPAAVTLIPLYLMFARLSPATPGRPAVSWPTRGEMSSSGPRFAMDAWPRAT